MKSIQFVALFTCSLSLLATTALAEIGNIRLVRDIASEDNPVVMQNFHLHGDQLLFTTRESAWSIDLLANEASRIGPVENQSISGTNLETKFFDQDDGFVYFRVSLEETGREWWRTDGTPDGTAPLPELGSGTTGWVSYRETRNTGDGLEFHGKQGDDYGWWRLQDDAYSLLVKTSDFPSDGEITGTYPASGGTYFVIRPNSGDYSIYFLPDSGTEPIFVCNGTEHRPQLVWGNRLLLSSRSSEATIFQICDEPGMPLNEIYNWEYFSGEPDPRNSLITEDPDLLFIGGRDLWLLEPGGPFLKRLMWGFKNTDWKFETLKPMFLKDDQLYFLSYGRDPTRLWRIPIAGGEKELVLELDSSDRNTDLLSDVVHHNGQWFFLIEEAPTLGIDPRTLYGLWATDGAASGSRKLATITNPTGDMIPRGGEIILPAALGDGTTLYFCDINTTALREWCISDTESENLDGVEEILGTHKGFLIFKALPDIKTYPELWTSDGSSIGTRPFLPKVLHARNLFSTSGSAYVYTNDNRNWESAGNRIIWILDPMHASAEGLEIDFLADETVRIEGMMALGDSLYIVSWKDGVYSLARIRDGSSTYETIPLPQSDESAYLAAIGDNLVLEQSDAFYRLNLPEYEWQFLLESESRLYAGSWKSSMDAVELSEYLFRVGDEGLALSDGTVAGTRILFEVIDSERVYYISNWIIGTSLAYFTAGESNSSGNRKFQLWAVSLEGGEPWKIVDLSPTINRPHVQDLAVLGDTCYFRADDGVHGFEMWVTDGTPEGTRMLEDIIPGPGDSFGPMVAIPDYVPPYSALPTFREKVYFNGFTGGQPVHDWSVPFDFWETDGTVDGTGIVNAGSTVEPIKSVDKAYLFYDLMVLENTLHGLWIIGDDVSFVPSQGWYPVGFAGETFRTRVFDGGDLLYVWENDDTYGSELFAIDLCSARGYFSNSTRAADGWSWHPVYRWIWGAQFPWIWLQDAGSWLYCLGDGVPSANLYHPVHGWLYSPVELYPWVYRRDPGNWIQLD